MMALSTKTNIFERALSLPRMNPVAKDALISLPELSGTGEDAAAVDPYREIERHSIFQGQQFRAFLGGPIERYGRVGGEGFAYSVGGESGRRKVKGGKVWNERVVLNFDGEFGQRFDRIDPAGAKKDEARLVPAAIFEEMDGATEVVVEELLGTGLAVHPGKNAGIGGTVDNPIRRRKRGDVVLVSDVADSDVNP